MKKVLDRQTVLIPVASNYGGTLLAIDAVDQVGGEIRDWLGSPQVARLVDVGLYQTAEAMQRLSVRFLRERTGAVACASRRRAWLENSTPGLSPELDDNNQDSAQLGLLLLLLAYEGCLPIRAIAATGTVGADMGRYAILPVGGLANKMQALAKHLRQSKGGAFGTMLPLITPINTPDGLPVADALKAEIEDVITAGEQIGVRVKHMPSGDIDAVVDQLGRLRPTRSRIPLLLGSIGIFSILAILGAGISWARSQPVELRAAPAIRDEINGIVAIPDAYRGSALRGVWDGTDILLCPLLAPALGQTYQQVLVGDRITISVEMPHERFPSQIMTSVFLQLGTHTAPSVHEYKTWPLTDEDRKEGLRGPYWSAQTSVIGDSDGAEKQILIGAGAKRGPVDLDALSEELRKAIGAIDANLPLERLNRAHEIFSARFPGSIFWRFHVDATRTGKKGSCDDVPLDR